MSGKGSARRRTSDARRYAGRERTQASEMKPILKDSSRRILRTRKTEEWETALASIRSAETRTICSCIVWFDFFSDAEPPRQAPAIIRQARSDWDYWLLIHRRINTRPRDLEKALISLGYHPEIARKRSLVGSE